MLGEDRKILGPESNSLLNLGMNLSALVLTRSMIALKPLTNCWKRAALIIGHALSGHPIVPRLEDLPESLRRDVVESLGDALKGCDVDYYLLIGNEIPPLIRYLAYTPALAWAFIDRYNEAIAELNRILNIAKGKGGIYDAERLYGLGLASITADVARLGRDVKPSDADIALRIASFAIKSVASPIFTMLTLNTLEPLRNKTPHRYLELPAPASDMEKLDPITVRYIPGELNEILDNYGDMVKEHAWSLLHAIFAYAVLLRTYFGHFNSKEVGDMVGRVADLLNELGRFESSQGVLEKLNDKKNRVQELMDDKEFMSYIESWLVRAGEEAVSRKLLKIALVLEHELALYLLDNNELVEARDLFNEVAEDYREIGDYRNYLVARGWVLRVEAIKGSLVGEKLVNKFRQLYEETFKEEHFKLTATYLSIASGTLGEYLVSLALTGNYEMINELLEKHLWVLNANKRASVLTRLMLNVLLSPRGRLSSELEGKLSVNPEELIDAFKSDMYDEYPPALRVAFKMKSPEKGYEECMSIEDSKKRKDCEDAVSAVMDDSDAVGRLRWKLTYYFKELTLKKKRSGWFRELGFDTNALISGFEKLVYGLDDKSLAQLIAPGSSMALLALMLHALINGNKELAKAHALFGAIYSYSKLLGRLYLEVYKECCDLKDESFRLAIVRLFFLHI